MLQKESKIMFWRERVMTSRASFPPTWRNGVHPLFAGYKKSLQNDWHIEIHDNYSFQSTRAARAGDKFHDEAF